MVIVVILCCSLCNFLKRGGDYVESINVFSNANAVNTAIELLKVNMAASASWTSPETAIEFLEKVADTLNGEKKPNQ
jgi:Tfp pilus assembly protein PilZ